jgi:Family of unknown function (DUF6069)
MAEVRARAGTGIDREERATPATRQSDLGVAVVAVGAAGAGWLAWRAAGVDLAVRAGDGTQHVGLVGALVTAAVAAVVAGGVLRVLERRTSRALTVWTWLGVLVLLVSLAGPAGAVSGAATVALASLHLTVGAVVLLGQRRLRRHGVA